MGAPTIADSELVRTVCTVRGVVCEDGGPAERDRQTDTFGNFPRISTDGGVETCYSSFAPSWNH